MQVVVRVGADQRRAGVRKEFGIGDPQRARALVRRMLRAPLGQSLPAGSVLLRRDRCRVDSRLDEVVVDDVLVPVRRVVQVAALDQCQRRRRRDRGLRAGPGARHRRAGCKVDEGFFGSAGRADIDPHRFAGKQETAAGSPAGQRIAADEVCSGGSLPAVEFDRTAPQVPVRRRSGVSPEPVLNSACADEKQSGESLGHRISLHGTDLARRRADDASDSLAEAPAPGHAEPSRDPGVAPGGRTGAALMRIVSIGSGTPRPPQVGRGKHPSSRGPSPVGRRDHRSRRSGGRAG